MPADTSQKRGAYRLAAKEIARRSCIDMSRRLELESEPLEWLKFFFSKAYDLDWGKPHREIAERTMYAIRHGGRYVCAAPRGTGKSAVVNGLVLLAKLSGLVQFPVVVPWSIRDAKKAMRFWDSGICFNETLAEYYPEFCDPFRHGRGVSQKIRTISWEDTGDVTGAQKKASEGMIIFPDSLGVIGSGSLNGQVRGLYHATEDGGILRPDLVIIDDPSDAPTAKSEMMTADNIRRIDNDVLGMAGPGVSIAAVMPATIINSHDTASHYIANEEWQSTIVPQVISWPSDMDIWQRWNKIRLEGIDKKDGGAECLKFYRANYRQMTDGMAVSWEHRYDEKRGQPDAYYAAMVDFYKMGKRAFFSERQNAPIEEETSLYVLDAESVTNKANNKPTWWVPDDTVMIHAFSDINRVGLHWCCTAFNSMFTPHVCAYGRWPTRGDLWEENSNDSEIKGAIAAGLAELAMLFSGVKFVSDNRQEHHLAWWMIDRGYQPQIVHAFCSRVRANMRVVPSRGFNAKHYRLRQAELIGQPQEQSHLARSRFGAMAAHCACYWREVAQRSFLGNPGDVGTASIFGERRNHRDFANHITDELLKWKIDTDAGMRWEWSKKPGNNDWLDAYTGTFVAAALNGLKTGESEPKTRQRKKRRRRITEVNI